MEKIIIHVIDLDGVSFFRERIDISVDQQFKVLLLNIKEQIKAISPTLVRQAEEELEQGRNS